MIGLNSIPGLSRVVEVDSAIVRDVAWASAETMWSAGLATAMSVAGALVLGAGLYHARRAARGVAARLVRIVAGSLFTGYLVPFVAVLMVVLTWVPLVGEPARWDPAQRVEPGAPLPVLVPLVVAGVLFGVRVIERELNRVDPEALDTVEAMGGSPPRVWSTLVSEAAPGLVTGLAATLRWLVACTAVLGVVIDHGLGGLLARYLAQGAPAGSVVLAASALGALAIGVHVLGVGLVRLLQPHGVAAQAAPRTHGPDR